MSEAAREFIGLTLRVCSTRAIHAAAMKTNPASRRVLEKCGFVSRGDGVVPAPARGGPVQVEHFWLTRDVSHATSAPELREQRCA